MASPAPLACPRDGAPLTPTPTEEIEVFTCPRCDGTWVPRPVLTAAVAIAAVRAQGQPPGPRVSMGTVVYARCPACARTMARKNYLGASGVVVDDCPWCGVWFDGGELARVGVFLANGGIEKAQALADGLADERERTRKQLERLEAKARAAEHNARRFGRRGW